MSLTARPASEAPVAILRYFDAVVLVVAAPVMLLIGVPALGYGVGAGAWLLLRAVGVSVDRLASASAQPARQVGLRMAYLMGRLFLLALAIVYARQQGAQGDGLAALAVIVFAFTVQLGVSFADRPRAR
jgi:hypothetical protein